MLERISPENGEKLTVVKGQQKIRNVYRPWLKAAFRVGLESGRRREEVMELKFNNVLSNNEGTLLIKVQDFKTNRSQNRQEEEELKYIYIPVTVRLKELLDELGYETYKGQDRYIIAPEEMRSEAMLDALSNAFTHYYSQLNTGRELTFKCLRKTYITNLSLYMGNDTKSITKHSSNEVIEKHYLDKEALAKAASGFDVFAKEREAGRKKEIQAEPDLGLNKETKEVDYER